MSERLRIALLIESSRAHGRDTLFGVAAYARAHGPWSFFFPERVISSEAPSRLRDWKPDGIIARIGSHKLLRQIREMRLPTVDICEFYPVEGMPRIDADHRATAPSRKWPPLTCWSAD